MLGKHNEKCYDNLEEEIENINLSQVKKVKFSSQQDKRKAIDLLYDSKARYIIIEKEEFKKIKKQKS